MMLLSWSLRWLCSPLVLGHWAWQVHTATPTRNVALEQWKHGLEWTLFVFAIVRLHNRSISLNLWPFFFRFLFLTKESFAPYFIKGTLRDPGIVGDGKKVFSSEGKEEWNNVFKRRNIYFTGQFGPKIDDEMSRNWKLPAVLFWPTDIVTSWLAVEPADVSYVLKTGRWRLDQHWCRWRLQMAAVDLRWASLHLCNFFPRWFYESLVMLLHVIA